ncbi:hypothetical protein COCNU_01G021710 [Cocos nucifera]|uniref:Uncharacterized protein n=1 Tax=Cocos nucifera TaxID=13894 RepID=A0A8K0HX45_COCNU|nr:hypothetical protein COCNU_01G021710 [Cocos nucifera]
MYQALIPYWCHTTEPVHIDEGESISARSFGISAGNIDGSKHQDASDMVTPSKKKYDQPWKMDPLSSQSSTDDSDPVPDEKFREASASSTQNENSAEELGLLKESEKTRMLFFQLPQSLPFVKLPAVAGRRKEKGSGLHELPAGYVGRMMVYKSGKVKMKLGETLFDVSLFSTLHLFAIRKVVIKVGSCSSIQVNDRCHASMDKACFRVSDHRIWVVMVHPLNSCRTEQNFMAL